MGKWCREGLSDAGLPQNFTHTHAHTDTHAQTHARAHTHTHTSPGPAAQRPLSVNGLEATCRATRIPQCPRALAAHRDPRARRVGGWQGPRATRSMACRHDLCPEPVSAWADSSGRLPGPPSQPLGLPAALCGRDLSCGLRTPGPPRTRVPPFLCPGNPSEAFGARQAGGGPALVRSVLPDAEAAGAGPCLGPQPEKVCLAPGDHPARVRPPPPPGPRRPWGAGTEPAGSCLSCVRVLGAQACHPLAAEALRHCPVDTGRLIPDGGREGQLVGPAAHTAHPPWTRGPGRRAPPRRGPSPRGWGAALPASCPPWPPMALRTREAGACLGLGGPVGVEGAGPCLPLHPPFGCPLASEPSRALGLPPRPWVGLRPGAPASSPGNGGNRALPGLSRPPVASSCLERLGFPRGAPSREPGALLGGGLL